MHLVYHPTIKAKIQISSNRTDISYISGYKFETLCLLPSTWDTTPREYIEGREDLVVNNHAQYCSVVKTGIGKSTMIIGGEVDASPYPHLILSIHPPSIHLNH